MQKPPEQTTVLAVPEWLADAADARAMEIFHSEIRFNRPLRVTLGAIYLMGVRAGIDAAWRHANAKD